ncbi:hypothetical protein JQR88_21545 (plasmid) [Pseudomonas luteola]|uniref:hypothetical protein n=1 Tax=Pseudomonas luteola TaxID=47886 RepID=UPI003DA15C2E
MVKATDANTPRVNQSSIYSSAESTTFGNNNIVDISQGGGGSIDIKSVRRPDYRSDRKSLPYDYSHSATLTQTGLGNEAVVQQLESYEHSSIVVLSHTGNGNKASYLD